MFLLEHGGTAGPAPHHIYLYTLSVVTSLSVLQWILELDSSTLEKFSRHLVIRVPGCAFPDNAAVGALVRTITSRSEALQSLYLAKNPSPAAAAAAAAAGGDAGAAAAAAGDGERVCFVDGAVYSKNRHFRLVGSSKGGKKALLQPTLRYAMSAASK
jgi:hypothetical protein